MSEARLASAIIGKATRLYMLPRASLGTHGEFGEGATGVRRDYNLKEALFGITAEDLAGVELADLVDVEDVIAEGLGQDPEAFPEWKLPVVERALEAAINFVELEVTQGSGFA